MYKERIAKLMNAVKDDSELLDFIEERMKTFTDYMSHVAWMETRIQRLDIEGVRGQEYRDEVQRLDSMRRSKHDVAMGSINQLNRMSANNKLEPFYDGPVDHENRTKIGDVIGNIVDEYFEGRVVGQLSKKDLMNDADFTEAVESIKDESASVKQ